MQQEGFPDPVTLKKKEAVTQNRGIYLPQKVIFLSLL